MSKPYYCLFQNKIETKIFIIVEENLLRINLDCELKFEKHIAGICNKAGQEYMFCPEPQATCC